MRRVWILVPLMALLSAPAYAQDFGVMESAETVNQVVIGRHLVARHAIGAVELAMELAGGPGFYRASGLERRFRDIQAARYHPLQPGPQAQYTGAMALGLPVDRIY